MTTAADFSGDIRVRGRGSFESLDIPAGTLINEDVAADADIDASKLQHQHQPARS